MDKAGREVGDLTAVHSIPSDPHQTKGSWAGLGCTMPCLLALLACEVHRPAGEEANGRTRVLGKRPRIGPEPKVESDFEIHWWPQLDVFKTPECSYSF